MSPTSWYKAVNEQDVKAEYSESASEATPFERAKWGSEASMVNRFRFALRTLPMDQVHQWLDIGCGEADFFKLAEEEGHRFERLTGLDITPTMLEKARAKEFTSQADFFEGSLLKAEDFGPTFDLVTMLGVLQQCGMRPSGAIRAAAGALKTGGVLFVTTKHIGWEEFTSGRLRPDANHSWFTVEEIRLAMEGAGLTLLKSGGFLPREDREVLPEESHMIYMMGRRQG